MKPYFCPDREDELSENNPFTHLIGDLGQYEKPFYPSYTHLAEVGTHDEGEVKVTREEALNRLIDLGLVVRER